MTPLRKRLLEDMQLRDLAQGTRNDFAKARRQTGVKKPTHVHTLRHSYATHLLEAGV